ncbi:MAG: hypothetical protein NTZ73_02775 [Candidatus Diapherotrites archaeon]|nr:hypothetical protein [Candidatus Diapherotrites archaeon]
MRAVATRAGRKPKKPVRSYIEGAAKSNTGIGRHLHVVWPDKKNFDYEIAFLKPRGKAPIMVSRARLPYASGADIKKIAKIVGGAKKTIYIHTHPRKGKTFPMNPLGTEDPAFFFNLQKHYGIENFVVTRMGEGSETKRFFFNIKRKKPLDVEMGKMRLVVMWMTLNPLIEKYKSAPETERAKIQREYDRRVLKIAEKVGFKTRVMDMLKEPQMAK